MKWFVVCVNDDLGVVKVRKATKKPVYASDKDWGGIRHCNYDGMMGEDLAFATGFLGSAILGDNETEKSILKRRLVGFSIEEPPYLQVQILNILESSGILSVGDLVSRSAAELLELRNFGPKALSQVRAKLAQHGLALRGDSQVNEPAAPSGQ